MEEQVRQVLDSFVNRLTNPVDVGDGECESPIEEQLFEFLIKVTNDDVRIVRQHNVDTDSGRFRSDFRIDRPGGGMAVGIECDGKDFHSPLADSKRDAAIVATGVVDKIYRIKGHDIVFHLADSIHLLSIMEPWIFTERARVVLSDQSHPEHLREDSFGRAAMFFTHTVCRLYQRPDTDDEVDETKSHRATFINITSKEEC